MVAFTSAKYINTIPQAAYVSECREVFRSSFSPALPTAITRTIPPRFAIGVLLDMTTRRRGLSIRKAGDVNARLQVDLADG